MSYIGNNLESLGNRSILSLSGSTPATAYTLQKNSANFSTVAENLIVVHQGVIQQPIEAYTVNGSTITFSESVAKADVFILSMGEAVTLGEVSDGVITASKLHSNFYVENPTAFADLTISASKNSVIAGPISVSGTLTVGSNATLVII